MRVLYTTSSLTFTILPPSITSVSPTSDGTLVLPPGSQSFPCTFSHQLFPGEILYLKDLPHGYGTRGSRRGESSSPGEVQQRYATDLSMTVSSAALTRKEWLYEQHLSPTPARLKGWEIHVVLCATDWGVAGKF